MTVFHVHSKSVFFLILFIAFFFACEKESNYRFKDETDDSDSSSTDSVISTENYPDDGSLAFYENFQSWTREGYVNQVKHDCETDLMTSTIIMYRPDDPEEVVYDDFEVSYTMQDFAVNPVCGNKAGTSTDSSTVSNGYIALQSEIYYECGGHNSDAEIILSELPSVSKVVFSISYGGDVEYVGGITLWKKDEDDDSFVRVGDYEPADPEEGERFTVELDETNVKLKFTPAISSMGTGVNDGEQADRNVRLHDLYVWSMAGE